MHDEFEAIGAGHGIPADVVVTFSEALGSPAPAEDGHEFGQAAFGVTAINALPEDMSCRAPGLEVMALIKDRTEVVDFGFLRGSSDNQRGRAESRRNRSK